MPARRFLKPPRRLLSAPKISVRARKLDIYRSASLPPVRKIEGLNEPESRIYWALTEMKIAFRTQVNLLGGSILGGARTDFLIEAPFKVDIEYQGPFHGTTYGLGRDVLRNLTVRSLGYRVEFVYERDLTRLKPRLREILGVPL